MSLPFAFIFPYVTCGDSFSFHSISSPLIFFIIPSSFLVAPTISALSKWSFSPCRYFAFVEVPSHFERARCDVLFVILEVRSSSARSADSSSAERTCSNRSARSSYAENGRQSHLDKSRRGEELDFPDFLCNYY